MYLLHVRRVPDATRQDNWEVRRYRRCVGVNLDTRAHGHRIRRRTSHTTRSSVKKSEITSAAHHATRKPREEMNQRRVYNHHETDELAGDRWLAGLLPLRFRTLVQAAGGQFPPSIRHHHIQLEPCNSSGPDHGAQNSFRGDFGGAQCRTHTPEDTMTARLRSRPEACVRVTSGSGRLGATLLSAPLSGLPGCSRPSPQQLQQQQQQQAFVN